MAQRTNQIKALQPDQVYLITLPGFLRKKGEQPYTAAFMKAQGGMTQEAWGTEYQGRFAQFKANSAADIAGYLGTISESCGLSFEDMKARIFFASNGGVIPYNKFFVAGKESLRNTYNAAAEMHKNKKKIAKTHARSFPHLIKFDVTDKTIERNGKKKFTGNHFEAKKGWEHYFSSLSFEDSFEKPEKVAFKRQILDGLKTHADIEQISKLYILGKVFAVETKDKARKDPKGHEKKSITFKNLKLDILDDHAKDQFYIATGKERSKTIKTLTKNLYPLNDTAPESPVRA